jgi:cytochrome c oxidase assembly protein subunit 15
MTVAFLPLLHAPEPTSESATVIDRRYSWLHRFALFTAVATLVLIWSGGNVTSKGAGLAVPDWPNTFGYNMFLFPVSQWVGGIFSEHVHRLIASTIGFLTIILALWLWRVESRRWLRNLGYAALVVVILQGVLGGLRVTMLKDEIGIFHACLAQGFFGMLIVIALATSRLWQRISAGDLSGAAARNLARVAIITTGLIYAQLALGATMRHQHRDLAILDFPTAYGKILPDVTSATLAEINAWRNARALSEVTPGQIWLQMAHRFLALAIAAGVIACLLRARAAELRATPLARLADAWFLLLASQITLGAWVIWSNKAADIATAHVAVGAGMLAIGISISAICLRLLQRNHPAPRPEEYSLAENAHAS